MHRLLTVALAALFASPLWAQAPADPDAAEPPLMLVLRIDGEEHPIHLDQQATLPVHGRNAKITVAAGPHRQFDKNGLRFRYPRGLRYEYDRITNPIVLTIWTFEGEKTVMSVFRYFKKQGTPEELRTQFLAVSAPRQFGAANILEKKEEPVRLGGHDLVGARLKVQQNNIPTLITYASFASGPHVFTLMVTNTQPEKDGTMAAETAEVLDILGKTFRLPGSGSGSGAVASTPVSSHGPLLTAFTCALLLLLFAGLLGRGGDAGSGPLGLPHGSVRWLLAMLLSLAALARVALEYRPDAFREAALWMSALMALAALGGRRGSDLGHDTGPAPLGFPLAGPLLGLLTLAGVVWVGVVWIGRDLMTLLNDVTIVPFTLLTAFWLGRAERASIQAFGGGSTTRFLIGARAGICLVCVAVGAVSVLHAQPLDLPYAHLIEMGLLGMAAYYAGAR